MNPVRNIKFPLRNKISNGVKIIIKNFQKKVPVHPKAIKKAVHNTLSSEGIKKSGEITICLVNDKEIKALNLKYFAKNKPTDVLTFDITEPEISDAEVSASRRNASKSRYIRDNIFADIVISTDSALRNAKIYQTSYQYELYLYVIHGMLHLIGYDDRTVRQRQIMDAKASQILDNLEIK